MRRVWGQGACWGTITVAVLMGASACAAPPAGQRAAPPAPHEIQQISQTIGPGGEIFQQVGGITQQVGPGGTSQQLGFSGGPFAAINQGGQSSVVTSGGGSTIVSTGGGGSYVSSTTRSGNTEEIVQTYGVTGNPSLDIQNLDGGITIRRASGPNLEVRIRKEALGDVADLAKVNIQTAIAGSVSLRTVSADPAARVRVHYDVALPSHVALGTVETGAGDIVLMGVQGGRLTARGGAIRTN